MLRRLILFMATFFVSGSYSALAEPAIEEELGLAAVFEARGVDGCFVMFDGERDVWRVYNRERAQSRFLPASTFKIANALIGLELSAARDVDEVIPYGGTDEAFDGWERDMSLREAMKVSNVPVFHQLARRIGIERMGERVKAFGYGNTEVGDDVEQRFWLTGPLAISALEQVEFIRRYRAGELPIRSETAAAVREILEYEIGADYAIFGKSGWAGSRHPETGWWVGWVEKRGATYPFAVNIDVATLDEAKHRLPVALECLERLGVL